MRMKIQLISILGVSEIIKLEPVVALKCESKDGGTGNLLQIHKKQFSTQGLSGSLGRSQKTCQSCSVFKEPAEQNDPQLLSCQMVHAAGEKCLPFNTLPIKSALEGRVQKIFPEF